MTIKKQIEYGSIQNVCHLHNGILTQFNFVTLCQFTLSLLLCYSLNFTKLRNYRMGAYMAASAYHVISKEVENHIITSGTIEFLYTCIFKQSSLTKEWNYNTFMRILFSYFRYTGRLFVGCAPFVACCNTIRSS